MRKLKIISFILFLIFFTLVLRFLFILNQNNFTISVENKNIFKNMLLDDVIENYRKIFISENLTVTSFEKKENKEGILLYSEIYSRNLPVFEIQYDNLNVNSLKLKIDDIQRENIEDVVKILSLAIQVSDISITKEEAHKIIINMIKEFVNTDNSVTLSYENNLIYILSIVNNNSLEFKIK